MSTGRANILVVVSDQLSAQALPAWGNAFAQTPNIDRLVGAGVRYERAYTPCPLCQPARAALWTGCYPHQIGVTSNCKDEQVSADRPTLGSLFREAGYETVHFGKQHDGGALRGFDRAPVEEAEVDDVDPAFPVDYDTRQDRHTRRQAVDFLKDYRSGTPYLAVVDFNNPHDICNWVGANQGPHEDVPHPGELPPLPANLYIDDLDRRPLPVQYICCAHNRQAQIAEWNEDNIRRYLLAYHHYLSRLDREIGHVLSALAARPDADNTLIVLLADHGDAMCGRWMATKHTSFYEETVRVPLVFAGPAVRGDGRSVGGLASLLDVTPTLCDCAGLPIPGGLVGRSLRSSLVGETDETGRDEVLAQWHTEWGFTVEPGRMLRTPRYKYTHYLEGDGEELYDLENDPGETRTLVGDPSFREVLGGLRERLRKQLEATEDPYFDLAWKADPRWRTHPPGFRNHRGPTAPTTNT